MILIKKYQNRKMYDTDQTCYIALNYIIELVQSQREFKVIENRTQNDITNITVFDAYAQCNLFKEKIAKQIFEETNNG